MAHHPTAAQEICTRLQATQCRGQQPNRRGNSATQAKGTRLQSSLCRVQQPDAEGRNPAQRRATKQPRKTGTRLPSPIPQLRVNSPCASPQVQPNLVIKRTGNLAQTPATLCTGVSTQCKGQHPKCRRRPTNAEASKNRGHFLVWETGGKREQAHGQKSGMFFARFFFK